MLILYCIGFVCTLVAIRAFEEYSLNMNYESIRQQRFDEISTGVKACGYCRGSVSLENGQAVVGEAYRLSGSYICVEHTKAVQKYNLPRTDGPLFSKDSIMGAAVWPISLPLTVFSFAGKYYGKLIYHKNLMKQFQLIQDNKEVEKYLSSANEEISKFLEKGA